MWPTSRLVRPGPDAELALLVKLLPGYLAEPPVSFLEGKAGGAGVPRRNWESGRAGGNRPHV